MKVVVGDLEGILQEIMFPDSPAAVDIPTFRSRPVELTQLAAEANGVGMTPDELRLVAETLVHPFAIATWNLVDPSQDEIEVSGLGIARPAFRYAITMHTIMVLLGVVLLGASLVASIDGATLLAGVAGGLGLSSLTAVFFVAPLQDLYRSLGTRIQLEILGLGHQRQMDLYRMYAKMTQQDTHLVLDAAVLPRIRTIAERTLAQVEGLDQPQQVPVNALPQPTSAGELPIAMSSSGTPGWGRKMPMEKAMDKPPWIEAPPPSTSTDTRSANSGEAAVRPIKLPMEPKLFTMDKVPMSEAPPTDPEQEGQGDENPLDLG